MANELFRKVYNYLWIRALKPRPFCHELEKFSMETLLKLFIIGLKTERNSYGYPLVFLWHHSNNASLADFFSELLFSSSSTSISISWIE